MCHRPGKLPIVSHFVAIWVMESNLRFDDITSAKKWMFVGGPWSIDSDKTFAIFLHADCLSTACTITFAISGSDEISIASIPHYLTHRKMKQSSAQFSPKYQAECLLLPATEQPAIIQDSVHSF